MRNPSVSRSDLRNGALHWHAHLIPVFHQRKTVMASNGAHNDVYDKDFEHLDSRVDENTALHKIQTAGSISISPELFEKI